MKEEEIRKKLYELIKVYEKLNLTTEELENNISEIDFSFDDEHDRNNRLKFIIAKGMINQYIPLDKDFLFEFFGDLSNDWGNGTSGYILETILEEAMDNNFFTDINNIIDTYTSIGRAQEVSALLTGDIIKKILENQEIIRRIYNINTATNATMSFNGDEILGTIIDQINRCDELSKDKKFISKVIDNIKNNEMDPYSNSIFSLGEVIRKNCLDYFQDKEFNMKVFEFIEKEGAVENLYDFIEYIFPNEIIKDENLALRYGKCFDSTDKISDELLNKRSFLEKLLEEDVYQKIIGDTFDLPEAFCNDDYIVEKYLKAEGRYEGINLERVNHYINNDANYYDNDIKKWMFKNIKDRINETNTIITSYEESQDSQKAIDVIQKWAEDNDLVKIGHPLEIQKIPKGQIKEGYLNIAIGVNEGSRVKQDGTIIIDGDMEYGIKNALATLKKLGMDLSKEIDYSRMEKNDNIDEKEFTEIIAKYAKKKNKLVINNNQAKKILIEYEQCKNKEKNKDYNE